MSSYFISLLSPVENLYKIGGQGDRDWQACKLSSGQRAI